MGPNGRDKLMSELMKDYDAVMFGQQDSDYDSEIDLDRDVPEMNVVSI
jgi:hypothetical protein